MALGLEHVIIDISLDDYINIQYGEIIGSI